MAREILLAENYSGLTMDALASALGMSKKTLYIHFASKDAIVSAIIDATGRTVRRQAEAAMAQWTADFTSVLRTVLGIISINVAVLTPGFMADIERFAPHLAREIEALKDRNIPAVFGRLIELGIANGKVRRDVDVRFVVEFLLQTMKSLHQTESLNRSGLTMQAAFEKALDLFLIGLLSPEGRAEYDPAVKPRTTE